MISQNITIKKPELYEKLRALYNRIGSKNYQGSMYYKNPSIHEYSLFECLFQAVKKDSELCKKLNALSNYFIEIRDNSFVFCEKESIFKTIVLSY